MHVYYEDPQRFSQQPEENVRGQNVDWDVPTPLRQGQPGADARQRNCSSLRRSRTGARGVTYVLKSGKEGTVHIEQVLEYNQNPSFLRDALFYKLTIEAQKRVGASPLAKREIIRGLGTFATQFYRLVDQTNYRKSVDRLIRFFTSLTAMSILSYERKAPEGRTGITMVCTCWPACGAPCYRKGRATWSAGDADR